MHDELLRRLLVLGVTIGINVALLSVWYFLIRSKFSKFLEAAWICSIMAFLLITDYFVFIGLFYSGLGVLGAMLFLLPVWMFSLSVLVLLTIIFLARWIFDKTGFSNKILSKIPGPSEFWIAAFICIGITIIFVVTYINFLPHSR